MIKKLLGAVALLMLAANMAVAASTATTELSWKDCGCDLSGQGWCTDLVEDTCDTNEDCEDDCL